MISNASPLITYAKLSKLDFLHWAIGIIMISETVLSETTQKESTSHEGELINSQIKRGAIIVKKLEKKYSDMAKQLQSTFKGLGPGESETIALALQERQAEVLMDDLYARDAAKLNDLKPVGSLYVLLTAFEKQIASEDEVKILVKRMVENKLWLSGEVIIKFIELLEKAKSERGKGKH